MDKILRFAASFAAAALLAACASTPTEPPANPFEVRKLPVSLQGAADTVVAANTQFALDLYSRLRMGQGNVFFSPFSVSTALAMTSAGAAGGTLEEMRAVLRFTQPPARLHEAYGALIQSLDRGVGLGGYELRVANRLWGQQGFGFLAPFLAITRDQYGAPFAEADFQGAAEEARAAINRWVEEKTADRIQGLFAPGTINSDTRLALVNAIYFKGLWASQFDRSRTKDLPFYVGPDLTVTVPAMSQTADYGVFRTDGLDVLDMPYKGGDLSMVILLPEAADGLAELERRLTWENLSAWLAGLRTAEVPVQIPRFGTTTEYALKGIIAEMGMPSAFLPDEADFSAMNGRRDLFIAVVAHKAFVQVNEEGTEAAAATGVGVGLTSVPVPVRVDHPFVFLIRDHVTGSVLFMGRIVNPAA
jgi:serpin B